MRSFSITDIPEFSKKERLVVVGIIGKSSFRHPNKTTPLLPAVQTDENGIQCYWDERNSILYLHAVTYMDTNQLMTMASNLSQMNLDKDSDSSHWLVAAGNLSAESCRAMALVFHLSHVVVLSSPTSVFDMGCLQIFKAIDALRLELYQQTLDALSSLGGNWESHGRSCCPRLLFHFRRVPRQMQRNMAALKRLEHTVEDQLYLILRKARIITNVCAKALFAIPKNEEFVYMSTDNEQGAARDISNLVQGLVDLCSGDPEKPPNDRISFKEFLNGHIELAFGEGFDDNVGKYAMSTSFFELPSAWSWREAARAIAPIYLEYEVGKAGGALYDALATDVRFSEARCAKVLPIAQASYNEGLPSHYSSQHHTLKLSAAISVLTAMARGPRAGAARARLAAACAAAWRAHKLCEALSLTGNPCVEPEHDNTKEHSSGVRYISACNCGRTKSSREDPYTVRKANHGFYEQAADECGICPTLQNIDFPVFQPSTTTFRAASVPGGVEPLEGTEAWAGGSGGWAADEPLSPRSEETSPAPELPLIIRGAGEKTISRQPSTTEYLPGMLHTLSPEGLLPAFPSWSCVCAGAASLYSAGPGLGEQLQPGLLPHAHHLMPWDARVEQPLSSWGATRRGKSHLTVKIFIGFEYECPRGHRFMMSSPDGVAAATSAAGGARLARSAMPLHAACPARAGKCALAQCARVHVVTPKAPVHVTLQPRDQRGGPGGGGGGTDKRRSVADFRGLEALLAEPSAPTNTLPIGFEGGGCWENATSPEPARSPRALVPPGCFPPRHPPSYASFSESARPGTGWSEETGTSGQSVTDLVTSLKSLALPPALPPAPQQNNRTSMHFTLSYEGVDSKMDSLWPPEANNNSSLASDRNVPPGPSAHPADTRAVSLARRASFCGVVRPDTNGTTAARWKGSLPERCADINSSFSPKVFFGGLPYDVTEQALLQTLKHFQPLRVEWPGPESSPRGFAYVTFENERRVRSLLGACRRGGTNGGTGWYYPMHCRKVQVIPWSSSDSVWARRAAARLEPQRTVFVGALHGMLTAADLAQIMDDLFGGVLYAGIDTDKNKYPIGSGRVTFDNVRSYVRAVSARHVEIITDKFSKKVQVDPYLEDSMCSRCQLQQGPYFCREPECYRYYCRSCWGWQHAREAHRPLMRNARAAPPPQRHCAHTDDYSSPPMSTLGAEGGDEEWSAALGPPPPARLGPAQQHEPPNAAQ